MNRFARLYAALDQSNKTNDKVTALESYFSEASPADAAWVVYLLCGNRIRQIVPVRRLAQWAAEAADVAPWLFDECYEAVGDLAETISLLLPASKCQSRGSLAEWIEERLIPLRKMEEAQQRQALADIWRTVSADQLLVLHKLITGAFRVGVSQRLATRALSRATGIDKEVIAHRLMGDWRPSAEFFGQLTSADTADTLGSRPYPFCLAYPLDEKPDTLGGVTTWQAEWKWDGIRAQLIRRCGQTYIWSRGEELLTERMPEIVAEADGIPDGTVLDGEILAWRDGVLPFSVMQKRIGRKTLGRKILAEAPVAMMAFDLLEFEGHDVRERPLDWRRQRLEGVVGDLRRRAPTESPRILASPLVGATSWDELVAIRQSSRQQDTEGLMLKRRDSGYGVGRTRGDWWKWKIDPYTVDAVLLYAQRGSGRRAGLYTDYTFAVWHEGQLVPFAKAYSGLSDQEIAEVDAFVRRHTIERFGPVRSVRPELVFEIAFENIQLSKRHKSGVAVRFPRIVRWRRDKSSSQADTLEMLKGLSRN
jgi:DNA ligase-1